MEVINLMQNEMFMGKVNRGKSKMVNRGKRKI